jgi:hypothetical protein
MVRVSARAGMARARASRQIHRMRFMSVLLVEVAVRGGGARAIARKQGLLLLPIMAELLPNQSGSSAP